VIKTQAELTKGVSQRFVDSLRKAGKTEAAIDLVISQLRVPSENRHDLELGQALSLIASREEAEGVHELASSLADQLRTHVTIINRDPDPGAGATQIGLSVDFQDAPKPLFPRL
jgi:hypothetical protein